VVQLFFSLETAPDRLQVAAYSPQTTLASDFAGNISVEKKQERSRGGGVSVTGPFDWPVKVSGSGDVGAKQQDAVRYELVPAKIPVAASGTIQGGSGVYFRLRASRSDCLEGAKEFSVTFRVPAAWRASLATFTCTAEGVERKLVPPLEEQVVCGKRRFLIALYQQGDHAAMASAERLIEAQSKLLRTVLANRRQIERSLYPTVAHKLGVLLDVIPPRLPRDWTEQLIFGTSCEDFEQQIAGRMPQPVREAASQYVVAREQISRLGEPETAVMQ
jgi:hypothetical protein